MAGPVESRRGARWTLAAVLLPVAAFLALTLPAVDFGFHWDEGHAQVLPVRRSLEAGRLSTDRYIYGGLNHRLNLVALAPEALSMKLRGLDGDEIFSRLAEQTHEPSYLLRLRRQRIILTALAFIWLGLLVRDLGGGPWQALAATSILALSWEVIYHSRWVASDAVVMQFGVLAVWAAVRTYQAPSRRRWPLLAGLAAGLGCGMKYPGGILILPVVLAIGLRATERDRRRWQALATALLAFAGTYLTTTPETVLHYRQWAAQLRRLQEIYATGWDTYTVGGEHGLKIVEYLALVALSPWRGLAAVLFALALWGIGVEARQRGRPALVVWGFALVYLAYFSLQKVMIVRNYLLVLPLLAAAAVLGMGDLIRRLPPGVRTAGVTTLAIALLAALGAHAVWQVSATRDIVERHDERRFVAALADHLDRRPAARFVLTPSVAAELAAHDGKARPNVVTNPAEARWAVLRLSELGDVDRTHGPGLFAAVFGPLEVHLDYYSTWAGQDRFVVVGREKALPGHLFQDSRK